MPLKVLACAALALSAAFLAGCGGPTKYDQAKFSDPQAVSKQAGAYWNKEGWWSLKPNHRKVAITEFSVEYVTENIQKTGADGLSVLGIAEMAGMGKRKREFGETFMREFPSTLYTHFVSSLESEGFSVVPMTQVTSHPAFAQISGAKAGKGSSAYGRNVIGGADRNTKSKFKTYPVQGLPVVDDGWFKAAGNAQAESQVASQLGADVALRIRVRVGLDDDGRAILDQGSTVVAIYDFASGKTFSGEQYYAKGRGMLVSKQAMRDDVPVITAKEFKAFQGDVYTIDSAKYQQSVMTMYPAYSRMAAIKLKN